MKLVSLIYGSRFCESQFDSSELAKISESSKRHNAESNLTGMLIFGDDCFLQCIEGDREAVSQTYNRITQDPRHESVTLLGVKEITKREFSEWDMRFALAKRKLINAASSSSHFNPFEMTSETAYELIQAHLNTSSIE